MVTQSDRNPPWLDTLLASMYPGGDYSAMAGFPNAIMPPNPWNKPMPGPNAGPGKIPEMQIPIQGQDPRFFPAPSSAIAPTRNPAAPPVPNQRNVGGAPSPGIPAPQGVNRTANNPPIAAANPNFTTFQYQVPNSSGGRAPIYTAANWGGAQPVAASPAANPQAAVRGALAPSSGGFDVNKLFAQLPDDVFDGSQMSNAPWGMGPFQRGSYGPYLLPG